MGSCSDSIAYSLFELYVTTNPVKHQSYLQVLFDRGTLDFNAETLTTEPPSFVLVCERKHYILDEYSHIYQRNFHAFVIEKIKTS